MDFDGPKNICIIDDDSEYGEFLSAFLRSKGAQVDLYLSGKEIIYDKKIPNYDFFIVDLGLPGIDGVDIIMLIRAVSNVGIIIVSGRMGPDAFNAGLSAGADMFLNKPVRFDQVLQAIKTVSHRASSGDTGNVSWVLDLTGSELLCSNGRNTKLTSLELRILHALFQNSDAVCSREQLSVVIGTEDGQSNRNLDAAIFRLRKKVESDSNRAAPIRTIHGLGYGLAGHFTVKST